MTATMVIMLVMMTMILTLLSRNHFCDNEKYDDGDDTNNDGGDVQNDDSGCGLAVIVRGMVVVMMKGFSAIQWFQLRMDGKTGAPKHLQKLR